MKRLVFFVLWTVIFFVMIAGAWSFAWDWVMRAGIGASLHQDFVDQVDSFAYLMFFATPLLGLLLGLFGRLPGTKLEHDAKHEIAYEKEPESGHPG